MSMLSSIDHPASFHAEALYQVACAACGRHGRFDAHHVVEKRHCRRFGLPLHSPDNSLRLCSGAAGCCHERHTARQQPIQLSALRDENIAFAVHHLGRDAAYVYLKRYYEGEDPRVEALTT